jgi:hypothetical protein
MHAGQEVGRSTDRVKIGRSGAESFPSVFWTDDAALSGSGFLGPA